MNKIVLLDFRGHLLKTLAEIDTLSVELAIVNRDIYDLIKSKPSSYKKVYFNGDFDTGEDDEFVCMAKKRKTCINYSDIKSFRSIQIEVERFYLRSLEDISTIQYNYFSVLSFWIDFFKKNKINYLISTELYHGHFYDMVLGVAKSFGVKVILFEPFLTRVGFDLCGVFDWNKKRYIPLDTFRGSLSTPCRKDVDFVSASDLTPKRNSRFIVQFLHSLGGNLLLLFLSKLLGRFDVKRFHSDFRFRDYLKGYLHLKKATSFYNKNCISPDFNSKYIYFSLHFDPEALTQSRTCISSQVFLIKMLSELVPDNVLIYVKEHPLYLSLNTGVGVNYFVNIKNFRSVKYYDQIRRMRNVSLIDMNVPSEEMARRALAISSISGSILPESISIYKKPFIMFDSHASPMGIVKDVFKVDGYNDCKIAIDKICNGFHPQYEDFESVLNKYCYKFNLKSQELMSSKDLLKLMLFLDK